MATALSWAESSGFLQITLGNLVALATILTFLYKLQRYFMRLQDFHSMFMVEHEILVNWYRQTTGNSMPTRFEGMSGDPMKFVRKGGSQ